MTKRILSHYIVSSPKLTRALELAVVTDLHDGEYETLMPLLEGHDAILLVGDLVQRHTNSWRSGARFVQQVPSLAPTFMSLGNHERKLKDRAEFMACVERSGVELLDGRVVRFGPLALGGFSSHDLDRPVDPAVVDLLAREDGFRLLMCHHPEYYRPYVAGHGIDLTLAGHAHGGQIQFFGRGVYSPGQGLFPRLTHGFYDDGHLLVSRGVTNGSGMPRWGNPCELIILHLKPEE